MSSRHIDAPGPPRFKLWSEVMNWSDILVLAEFELISRFTVNNEYRGDSDLTTTEEQPEGSLDHCKPGRPDNLFFFLTTEQKAHVFNLFPHQIVCWRVYTHFLCGEGQREGSQGSKSATKDSGCSLVVCLFLKRTPSKQNKQNPGSLSKLLFVLWSVWRACFNYPTLFEKLYVFFRFFVCPLRCVFMQI